jgi:hypothetical protein
MTEKTSPKESSPVSIPENAHTVFDFTLPFAIPVPNGLYEIYDNKQRIDVVIKRVQKTESLQPVAPEGYVQMQNDKYGRTSFSKVSMNFPRKIPLDADGRLPLFLGPVIPRKIGKEIVVKILNRFIDTVRYTTETFWVEHVTYQDLLSFSAYYFDGKNKYIGNLTLIDTGIGGMRAGNGEAFALSDEKLEKLKNGLKNEAPLDSSAMLLLNAKEACLEENHRLAVIEAVAGLEVILYNFINVQGKILGLPKKDLDNFIMKVGLTGNIKLVLKMMAQGLEQVDDGVLNECTGTITVRNHIMHRGLLEVQPTETENRIVAIEKMVSYLKLITPTIH